MGNGPSFEAASYKINYEDVQYVLKNKETHVLINTLSSNDQHCLLPNTLDINKEEHLINTFMQHGKKEIKIIIYGRHNNDETVYKKLAQLKSLGFYNIYIYVGGLFEWLMLQDIFGDELFPTTQKEMDFLKYKPKKIMDIHLIDY